ncbi:MAG: DUF4435 domain-containing protein [Nitrospirae bacterium]|uniref:DUF4435 domain-containing protein n=1 Tax=Candidatus Magnetobacterium casense TaxID=1455061 RepID=UPI00058C376B|nr:DUF4435 domain-containing protein [Candidatus Magnetobacterium casensis]MBF0336949.1 DUF4435 domain-containing protein [Nitrospirota bacterium]
MKDIIEPHRVANSIRMTRTSGYGGSFFIVEGETDVRLYGDFINASSCRILSGYGREKVIKILEILETGKFHGILAVVDADYWRLDNYVITSKNLLMTDTHDIETMILQSAAFDKFISEYRSSDKLKTSNVLDLLTNNALPIGYLRWISSRTQKNLDLIFKDIKYEVFIDHVTLSIDVKKMIKDVLLKSNMQSRLNENDLEADIHNKMTRNYDVMQVCCGKDLIHILSVGSKKLFGKHMNSEDIQRILRLTYNIIHFSVSALYGSIRTWEDTNSAFKVLKN